MKRILLTAAIVAAAAVSFSCSKEEQRPVSGKTTVLTATIESTKTVLADNGTSVLWSSDDAINVNGTASTAVTLSDDATSATFTFEGELTDPYRAVYPASAWVDDSHVCVPATQTYAENSFAKNAAVMLAFGSSSKNLTFTNVLSLLEFTIKADSDVTISSVSFEGNNNEQVSGSFETYFSTTSITPAGVTGDADKKVTLNGPIAVGSAGTTVYIAVPGGEYTNGFTLTITDSEGTAFVKEVTKSVTFTRGTIKNFTTALTFPTYQQPSETPEKLYLSGSAAEADSQEMRKEGDSFVIFNKLTDGEIKLKDENDNSYFVGSNGSLYVGDKGTTVSAGSDVTRITVNFSDNTVTYDSVGSNVYVQNAWDATVMASLAYQGAGVWKGTGTISMAANGDERYSLRVSVNGTDVRWGSNLGNNGTFPDGSASFWRLYETSWDQWSNLYKFYKGYSGVDGTFTVDGNNLEYMRHSVAANTTADVTLGGVGAECARQAFRKVSDTEYVIYSYIKGSDVTYTYNGTTTALTVPTSMIGNIVRITLNPTDGTATYDKIYEWVYMKFCADDSDIAYLDYRGNGIWNATSGGIYWRSMSWGMDERYYFYATVNDGRKTWGMATGAVNNDGKYSGDDSFWTIGEYDYTQWANAWKLDEELSSGATAFVEINTNASNVWKHTLTKN